MKNNNYTCPKCGNREFETGEMRATGADGLKYLIYRTKNLLR